MPALNVEPQPMEVSQTSRRRVWFHPELESHSLLVLTADRVYLAPLAGSPRPEVVAATAAAAAGGADLDDLLGALATVIELAAVRRVKLDLLSNALLIDISRSGRAKSRIGVTFATAAAADACFSRIWRRLGGGKLESQQRDWWSLTRGPLLLIAGILAATALLTLTIVVVDGLPTSQSAASVNVPGGPVLVPRSPLQAIFGWMDWRVVCALGGAATAVAQVWMYRRLTQPPVALEVIRT